jgi:hypothetical protein
MTPCMTLVRAGITTLKALRSPVVLPMQAAPAALLCACVICPPVLLFMHRIGPPTLDLHDGPTDLAGSPQQRPHGRTDTVNMRLLHK